MDYGELDQYILIKNIEKLVRWHQDFEKNINPYSDLILIQSSNPDVTLNRVLNCNKDIYLFFNNLTTTQKASLIPKLELYYMTKEGYKLINFKNFPNFEEFRNFATNTNTKFSFNNDEKEDGVGLKKITISDKNQNPGTVNLECKIELFFDSILSLTNSSVLELIKVPEIRSSVSEKDFRLKLVAGWQTPVDFSKEIFSTQQLEFIEQSNVVYLLSLVKHDLSFNENGSITLNILYQGALEKYLASSSDTDIFSLSSLEKINKYLADLATSGKPEYLEEYTKESINKITYEASIDFLSKKKLTATELHKIELGVSTSEITNENINKDIDEEISELEEKLNDTIKKLSEIELVAIKDKYSRFIKALDNKKRLFFVSIPGETYKALNKAALVNSVVFNTIESTLSPQYKISNFYESTDRTALQALQTTFRFIDQEFLQEIQNAEGDPEKLREISTRGFEKIDSQVIFRKKENPKYGEGGPVVEEKLITYTTLGDIINIARSFIDIPDNDVELILGPCIMDKFSINISSFPIALSTFMIWFVNSVVRQAKRKYQFWEFIYDIIGALVKPALLNVGLIPKEAVNINLATAIVISDKKLERGKIYLDQDPYHYLSKNIFDTKTIYSYMVLYMKDYEMTKRDGILEEDMQDGIYHFTMAKDRGIIKKIDFSKIDFARLRDMRLTTEGFNNVGDLLREHYDMNLKTIGSPLFIVGAQLYFDGAYLGETGKNITELLGLGGYYLITGIETTISKELYEAEVRCTWTTMRNTSAEAYSRLDISGTPK